VYNFTNSVLKFKDSISMPGMYCLTIRRYHVVSNIKCSGEGQLINKKLNGKLCLNTWNRLKPFKTLTRRKDDCAVQGV
jgi:hypothetical protein